MREKHGKTLSFFYCMAAGFCIGLPSSQAHAELPRFNADVETWGYYSHKSLVSDSILNPNNTIANVSQRQLTADVRINATIKGDSFDVLIRPRLLKEVGYANDTKKVTGDAYLSQGFARFKLPRDFTVTLGRELLTWGPANFRSPSNPFYFDAGRTQPLREVPGLDLARVHYLAGGVGVTAAYIFRDKSTNANAVRDPQTTEVSIDHKRAGLLKFDYRGSDYLLSAIASRAQGKDTFGGAFAQATLSDALLVYGEFGSIPPGQVMNYATGTPKDLPRRSTWLGGGSYTLQSGKVFSIEYLRDNRGLTQEEQRLFFSQVQQGLSQSNATTVAAASDATAARPPLLGKNYVSLVFQSDLQETSPYWRAMLVRNIQDHSNQAIIYLERKLSDRFSVFGSFRRNFGGPDTEFGAVVRSEAVLGLKAFAF
jgi:hypothetical protein